MGRLKLFASAAVGWARLWAVGGICLLAAGMTGMACNVRHKKWAPKVGEASRRRAHRPCWERQNSLPAPNSALLAPETLKGLGGLGPGLWPPPARAGAARRARRARHRRARMVRACADEGGWAVGFLVVPRQGGLARVGMHARPAAAGIQCACPRGKPVHAPDEWAACRRGVPGKRHTCTPYVALPHLGV